MPFVGRQGGERRVGRIDGFQVPGVKVQDPQVAARGARPGAQNVRAVDERVLRQAEHPLRRPELRFHRAHVGRRLGVHAVQVPPAVRIRHAKQFVGGRPGRLEDGHAGFGPDQLRLYRLSELVQFRHPQLGFVPRHVRMVPGQPSQLGSVPVEDGRGIEVVALGHDDHRAARFRVHHHQCVGAFLVGHGVVLADRVHASGGPVHRKIRVPALVGRQELFDAPPARRSPGVQAVVGEVAEQHLAVQHRVRIAAVLVHLGPHAVLSRHQIPRPLSDGLAHQGIAALVAGPHLHPVDIVVHQFGVVD